MNATPAGLGTSICGASSAPLVRLAAALRSTVSVSLGTRRCRAAATPASSAANANRRSRLRGCGTTSSAARARVGADHRGQRRVGLAGERQRDEHQRPRRRGAQCRTVVIGCATPPGPRRRAARASAVSDAHGRPPPRQAQLGTATSPRAAGSQQRGGLGLARRPASQRAARPARAPSSTRARPRPAPRGLPARARRCDPRGLVPAEERHARRWPGSRARTGPATWPARRASSSAGAGRHAVRVERQIEGEIVGGRASSSALDPRQPGQLAAAARPAACGRRPSSRSAGWRSSPGRPAPRRADDAPVGPVGEQRAQRQHVDGGLRGRRRDLRRRRPARRSPGTT